ncbi:GGDEF domain-containing protein [Hahella sp. SMD15-11]|uniref:diguanylate cyclase n=1 Tax=Thermohahella caldifontis TaxID=3142973 RepID=A0AB39UVG8_9GAMM
MSDQPENPDLNRAVRYLQLALPEMTEHKVPATPRNYAVWYEYVLGHNPELNALIDARKGSGAPFTEAFNDSLYQQFIADRGKAAIDNIRENVRQLINEMLHQAERQGQSLDTYLTTLESASQKLAGDQSQVDLPALVGELLSETRSQRASTSDIQASVKTMADEIRALRKEVERLHQEANTDPLTRVANRRAFDIALDNAIASAKLNGQPLSVVMLDIDYFKKVNDTHGHLVGDKVLRFIASVLRRQTKGKDTVARYGGEEFAIIMPETPLQGAEAATENIRRAIAAQVLHDSVENQHIGHVTISAGISEYVYGEEPDTLVSRADAALYRAKQNGRNRVEVADEAPHPA